MWIANSRDLRYFFITNFRANYIASSSLTVWVAVMTKYSLLSNLGLNKSVHWILGKRICVSVNFSHKLIHLKLGHDRNWKAPRVWRGERGILARFRAQLADHTIPFNDETLVQINALSHLTEYKSRYDIRPHRDAQTPYNEILFKRLVCFNLVRVERQCCSIHSIFNIHYQGDCQGDGWRQTVSCWTAWMHF